MAKHDYLVTYTCTTALNPMQQIARSFIKLDGPIQTPRDILKTESWLKKEYSLVSAFIIAYKKFPKKINKSN